MRKIITVVSCCLLLGVSAFTAVAADFTLSRLVVCAAVEAREPVGAADVFPASQERIIAYLEASEISADTAVTIVWSQGGEVLSEIVLPLRQGARWRTWASKQPAGRTGEWTVAVKDAAGGILQTTAFRVE